MAIDRAVDSSFLDGGLNHIAGAIRDKTGKSDFLAFPDDFVTEISGITGGCGSGNPTAESKDVNFIDYDGTIRYSYTAAEFAALSALPANPTHSGLTSQGWNWSLSDAQAYVATYGKLWIGQMYITDDGKTRIYIHLEEGRTSPMLGCCPNGTVTVDWGDGTAPDTLTGTSTSTTKWTGNHEYASAGDYVITLTVSGSVGFKGSSSSNLYSELLRYSSSADIRNKVYQNAIQKIEFGDGVTSIRDYAFQYCYSLSSITIPSSIASIEGYAFYACYILSSITIPSSITSIESYAFYACYSLSSITIPSSVTSIGGRVFQYCYSLSSITIPSSITSIGSYAFQYCYSLSSITIPSSITSIESYAFYACYSLSSITIPSSITSIGSYAFQNCYSLSSITIPSSIASIEGYAFSSCHGVAFYDFSNHTAVPTLSSTNAFTNIPADCEIRVPAALYDEWIAATNWSTYASYIVAV